MISISLMFTEIPFHLTMDTIHLLSINLAPVAAVSPFRPPVPTMATSPTDETDPMSNRYIPRAARAVPHEEVVHTIDFPKAMACSATGTSDFIQELNYTYGRLRYQPIARKNKHHLCFPMSEHLLCFQVPTSQH